MIALFFVLACIAAMLLAFFIRQPAVNRLRGTAERLERERDELRADLQRFSTIVNQTADAVMITDAEQRIVHVNPAFSRLLGYTLDEIGGKTPREFRTARHDNAYYRELGDTLRKGEIWRGVFTNRCKNGALLDLDTVISPVLDSQGRVCNYISSARDITREIQLEKQLRHAQKMEAIGTLAGGIAHDFNNILSAIIGYTELGLLDVPRDAPAEESLQQVLKASRRAADLVSQILTFSRRNAQERQPLLIGPIVKESIQLLRGTLPSTIQIRQSVVGDLPPVLADTTQMHQVIMNLCTNAGHAMRERGGVLDVALRAVRLGADREPWQSTLQAGEYVELVVSDTGHGMDPETLSRIFEPYFTTKRGSDGTGLGLSTVHGIVSLYDGALHAESEPGQGSAFTILLPVCPPESVIPDLSAGEQRLRRGNGERILVVDDEESIVKMIEAALTWLGYRVEAFTSSVKAFECFKDNPGHYDAIITDQTMPTLPGLDFARRILEIRPDMPVILCSGYSDPVCADGAKLPGIFEFVKKPAAGRELASVLQRLFHPGSADATV